MIPFQKKPYSGCSILTKINEIKIDFSVFAPTVLFKEQIQSIKETDRLYQIMMEDEDE